MELVKAVAAGKENRSVLKADMPALNGYAVALKERLDIPGVKAVKETGIVT